MGSRAGRKQELIELFSSDDGPGSTEAQVALLTDRIDTLQEHLKAHPKDHSSRRGLLALVSKRKRLLNYLRGSSVDRFRVLTRALGIRTAGGRVADPEAQREEAQKRYTWRRRIVERPRTPHLDDDTIDALNGPESNVIELLVHAQENAAPEASLESSRAPWLEATEDPGAYNVLSSLGDFHSVRTTISAARALASNPEVVSVTLRRTITSQLVERQTEEEYEHDSLGLTFSAPTTGGEDLTPLRRLVSAHPDRFVTGACKVLVIDDGFDLSRSFYTNQYGPRVTAICTVDSAGTCFEGDPKAIGNYGEGDHGDRVAQLILDIAPHVELFVAQRQAGNKLEIVLFDVMRQVNEWAKAAPLIVNLSFGSNLGAHDGGAPLELAFENNVFRNAPFPRYAVKSAGNEGNSGIHTEVTGPLKANNLSLDLAVSPQIGSGAATEEAISIWHDSRELVAYHIESPDGARTAEYCYSDNTLQWAPRHFFVGKNKNEVRMTWESFQNGDCELRVRISGDPIDPGTWRICFNPGSPKSKPPNMRIRAWLGRTQWRRARFVKPLEPGTITIPGTSRRVLTVTGHAEDRLPLDYASRGPIVNSKAEDQEKPDVALLATSKLNGIVKQGTSFAAPRMVGCLALLLTYAPDPAPSMKALRALLRKASVPGQLNGALGYGALDYSKFAAAVETLAG